jgi:predicted DNA-binding transcriptional regulator AlpA
MLPLTLTADEIREVRDSDGRAVRLIDFSPSYIRSLYRRGEFPPPINPQMNPRMWRWSRTRIERYIETGET